MSNAKQPELRTPARSRCTRFVQRRRTCRHLPTHLGCQAAGRNQFLADLGVSPADLDRARQSLLARRLLLSSADHRNVVLHPDTWPVLTTVLKPRAFSACCSSPSPTSLPASSTSSWRPGIVVLNKVDQAWRPSSCAARLARRGRGRAVARVGLDVQAAADGASPAAASPEAVAEKKPACAPSLS
jgi:hypothetical protein